MKKQNKTTVRGNADTQTTNAKGHATPLTCAYDRWVELLKSDTATDAEIEEAHAEFLATPEDLPTTDNLAYPLVEALERAVCQLAPTDAWYPEIVIDDDTFFAFPKVVDIEEIAFLYTLEWRYEEFPNAEDLIFDALRRSAATLGYVWSNGAQEFVKETCNG